jgi:O-antigen/teichoic acid export membrane protein
VDVIGTGIRHLTTSNVLDLLIAFVFYVVTARILGSSGMGRVALMLLLISLYATVSQPILGSVAARFVSYHLGRGEREEAVASLLTSLKILAAVSAVTFPAFMAASPLISRMTGLGLGLVVAGIAVGFVQTFRNLLGGALYGFSMYGEAALQGVLNYALSRIPAMALAVLMGPSGVVVAWGIGSIAGLIYPAYLLRDALRPREMDAAAYTARRILRYGMPLYALSLVGFLQGWLGISLLYAITGSHSAVGMYYVASASTGILGALYSPLTSVLLPSMSFRFGEEGGAAIRGMTRGVEGLVIYVVMTSSLSASVAARPILELFYGAQYAAYAPEFSILAATTVISALGGIYGTGLQSMGRTDLQLVIGASSSAALLGALVALAPRLGALGVALSSAISSIAGFVLSLHLIRRHAGHMPSIPRTKIAFSFLVALAVLGAQLLTGKAGLLENALADALAFAASIIALSRIMRPLEDGEREALAAVLPGALKGLVNLL